MRQLLKIDAKFEWNSQCQSEFDGIIHKLSHAPILQPLSVDKDFIFALTVLSSELPLQHFNLLMNSLIGYT
jgi:hypothetical protein